MVRTVVLGLGLGVTNYMNVCAQNEGIFLNISSMGEINIPLIRLQIWVCAQVYLRLCTFSIGSLSEQLKNDCLSQLSIQIEGFCSYLSICVK